MNIIEYEESQIGVENDEDLNNAPDLFSSSVIWGTDWTSETINTQLVKKNIDLFPKFQRRDAWSNKEKSKFIESLILGLPIPQIILAESQTQRGKYIVIDGKQRLLTIRRFFSEAEGDEFKPLKLSGLDILEELNGKTYSDIKNTSELFEYSRLVENQSIRTVIIKNWKNENFLYTVFLRLNTGSKQLSPQELRQALHPGDFIDFADDFSASSKQIQEMLNLKSPDIRMRDVELVIRYFTFKNFANYYDGNLKKAFDDTVLKLNELWDSSSDSIEESANNLNSAIEFTIDTFGDRKNAFSKWNGYEFQGNFNRAIFDIMVYYFSDPTVRDSAKSKKAEIVNNFKELCTNDAKFLESFEHTTKSLPNTKKRFDTWGKSLQEVLDVEITLPQFN